MNQEERSLQHVCGQIDYKKRLKKYLGVTEPGAATQFVPVFFDRLEMVRQ